MNIWQRQSITQNPYYRTAFRVTRVPRKEIAFKKVARLSNRTRSIIDVDPKAHSINGEPVTLAELNSAEQILFDPRQRMEEELLEHAAETLDLDYVSSLAAAAAESLAPGGGAPPTANLAGLLPWLDQLFPEYLESAPAGEASFGALELRNPPPFGRSGGD